MNLQEAIATTDKGINTNIPLGEFQHLDAVRLLIEAGKLVVDYREGKARRFTALLPGETKD